MLPEYFAFVSTFIASLGGVYYLYLTIKGDVQPNKVTFFFWGLLPMIGFFAQYSQGVGSLIWVTFAIGFIPFLIVIAASFNPRAYWKITHIDYGLAFMAMITMVIWYLTQNPLLALSLAIAADFFAGLPTLLKSYTNPFSEDWKPYALNSVGFFVGVLAVQSWSFEEYSFVLYLFVITSLIALVIYFRQKSLHLQNV